MKNDRVKKNIFIYTQTNLEQTRSSRRENILKEKEINVLSFSFFFFENNLSLNERYISRVWKVLQERLMIKLFAVILTLMQMGQSDALNNFPSCFLPLLLADAT